MVLVAKAWRLWFFVDVNMMVLSIFLVHSQVSASEQCIVDLGCKEVVCTVSGG
jgi:hypothetical protein